MDEKHRESYRGYLEGSFPKALIKKVGLDADALEKWRLANEEFVYSPKRYTLAIDPDLLDEALRVSGEKTKRAAVTKALTEFIARRKQKRILELFERFEWNPDFDYKSERTRG